MLNAAEVCGERLVGAVGRTKMESADRPTDVQASGSRFQPKSVTRFYVLQHQRQFRRPITVHRCLKVFIFLFDICKKQVAGQSVSPSVNNTWLIPVNGVRSRLPNRLVVADCAASAAAGELLVHRRHALRMGGGRSALHKHNHCRQVGWRRGQAWAGGRLVYLVPPLGYLI